MTRDTHEEARVLIALAGAECLSDAQQTWLRAHLEECPTCRDYGEAAGRVVGALRSLPVAADSRLVRATQMRVRFHAGRLQEARERMWLVGVACMAVGLSAAVTAPLLWRLFAWMGAWAGVSTSVWQIGFLVFYVAPALAVSVALLARGTHLGGNREGL
jgi:predicted anti-sigma-YlaC factor YlaD